MEEEIILTTPILKSASVVLEYTLRKLHKFDNRKLVKKNVYSAEENVEFLRGQKKLRLLREDSQEYLKDSQRAINSRSTINKIGKFFNLKRSKRVKLVKVNYLRNKFGNLKKRYS